MKITSKILKNTDDINKKFSYTMEYLKQRANFENAKTERDQEKAREIFLSLSDLAFKTITDFNIDKKGFEKGKNDIYFKVDDANKKITLVMENVGCVVAHIVKNKLIRLECIEVVEDKRNMGYGKKLMDELMIIFRINKYEGISLTANNQFTAREKFIEVNDRLKEFYEDYGFEAVEWREMFYVPFNSNLLDMIELNNIYCESIGIDKEMVNNMIEFEETIKKELEEAKVARYKKYETGTKPRAKAKPKRAKVTYADQYEEVKSLDNCETTGFIDSDDNYKEIPVKKTTKKNECGEIELIVED